MAGVDQESFVNMVLANLREACQGPADPKFTWFASNEPDSGLGGFLKGLTAEEASHAPSPNGKSIAAHVAHATFHLVSSAAWLNGDRSAADWETSWSPESVDEAGLARLRRAFDDAYAAVVDAVRRKETWGEPDVGGAVGAVAHAAYHLGAVRQIARSVRNRM